MVFFRAGSLALLEEFRDNIVLKLVRQLQAEVISRFRLREWKKRRDQRELIRVCQRQFRKYIALRDWGEYSFNEKFIKLLLLHLRLVHHHPEDKTIDWTGKS